MKFRPSVSVAAMAVLFAMTSMIASAQSNTITLYNGTVLNGRLNAPINSATANVGDAWSMAVVPPYPSGNPAFQGATMSGIVTRVIRAGQGRNPEIDLKPQYLHLADGSLANLHGTVTGVGTEKGSGNTAAKAAVGALAGMLVGNAIGKTIFHSGGGGAVGLIGGALVGANNKSNFSIPAGANATIQLDQTVSVRRQSRPY
jgi:hypothetical protein